MRGSPPHRSSSPSGGQDSLAPAIKPYSLPTTPTRSANLIFRPQEPRRPSSWPNGPGLVEHVQFVIIKSAENFTQASQAGGAVIPEGTVKPNAPLISYLFRRRWGASKSLLSAAFERLLLVSDQRNTRS